MLGMGREMWGMVEGGHTQTRFHVLPKHFLNIFTVAFASKFVFVFVFVFDSDDYTVAI